MIRIGRLVLFLILLGAFVVRLYRIDNPIADWHSWRQADTAAVTRNFVNNGIDLLHPQFDDLSKIPSGLENPSGWRFVEFPIYNATVATLFGVFNGFPLEVWGRLVSILSSLGSIIFLYLLLKKYTSIRIGLLGALFFGFTPYNIYYSRTILPDPSMVMAILGGTYFFDLAIKKEFQISNFKFQISQWVYFVLAIIFTASAFLLKPFALFFTLPMVYIAFRRWGIGMFAKWKLWFFAAITLVPLILWRLWMQQYPEGIPSYDWLFNSDNIRFKGAFFQWIFADRIGRLILGYWGIALLVIGLIRKVGEREEFFYYCFLASSLLYLVVIAGGNVRHDYYQILIVPTLAIFLAKGADFLLIAPKEYFSRVVSCLLLVVCCMAMLAFGWFYVRDYFNINNLAIVEAGQMASKILPKDAKVIAPYGGDTSFLYQTERSGWPVVDAPIEEMIVRGAQYLVIASPTDNDFGGFGTTYALVAAGKNYLILDLQSKIK